MHNFVISVSCGGVLMETLESCMHYGVATSSTTIGISYMVDLSMVKECSTTPLTPKLIWLVFCLFLKFEQAIFVRVLMLNF